jgi:surfactin family lipopeptide synthetase A
MHEVNQLSDAKRVLLDRYLKGRFPSAPKIERRPTGTPAPLSLVQEQIYLRQLEQSSGPPLYNECITIRMLGPVDADILQRSFNEIIRRHEAWRTSFETRAGKPVQVVHPAVPIPFLKIDLRDLAESDREPEALRLVGEHVRRPFQLDRVPLLRPILVSISAEDHRLFLVAHQIIVDGKSAYQIYPSELAAIYKAFLTRQPSPLPNLEIQCADFAAWQRERPNALEEKQIDYWRERPFSNSPAASWPIEKFSSTTQPFRGCIRPFAFPPHLSRRIRDFSRTLNSTLFPVLLTGVASVIHRYTNDADVVLGTLSPSGRKQSEVMDLLGYFLNPVALRLNCASHARFSDLLHHVRGVVLDAMSNDDIPIERLAHELGAPKGRGPSPFFNLAVSLQPPTPDVGLPWSVTSMDVESGGSPWPLYLAFIDRPTGIMGRVQFNPDYFDQETVQRLLQDLENFFETVCS